MSSLAECLDRGATWEATEIVAAILSRSALEVVTRWIKLERFLDAYEEPRVLSLDAGKNTSFHAIFDDLIRDVNVEDIRRELLSKGIVGYLDCNALFLKRFAYRRGNHRNIPHAQTIPREASVIRKQFRRRTDISV